MDDRSGTTLADPALGGRRRRRLAAARLYAIVEALPHGRPAADLLAPALAAGVDLVQLRDKDASDERMIAAAGALRERCDEHDALLIINDRPDLVVACRADGVHLGQDDTAPARARAKLGAEALIGVSTHSPEQVEAARRLDVDYIAVGPVHATPTKPGRAPVGLDLVSYAAKRSGRPFFAIGGIDAGNAGAVADAGATRVAVVRAIRDATDPGEAARALRAAVMATRKAGVGGAR